MSAFPETDDSTLQRLELRGAVPASASEVFAAFVEEGRITQWWPDEADIDPVVGGAYELRWPAMEWTLRGTFTDVDPDRRLAFTWSWDHEPGTPHRTVRITFTPAEAGTELTLTHGDYTPADAEERQSHLDGWQFFLGRLAALLDERRQQPISLSSPAVAKTHITQDLADGLHALVDAAEAAHRSPADRQAARRAIEQAQIVADLARREGFGSQRP
jgi:uncharacterized protein YndB with AHSA1/START domain